MIMAGGPEHLLIDGYNIIHDWPDLKRLLKQSVDSARAHLAHRMRLIHDVEGVGITIVYDGGGAETVTERPGDDALFSIVFTEKGVSADAFIEQIAARAADPKRISVASGDTMIAESTAASGARTVSPAFLDDWVRACEHRQGLQLESKSRKLARQWAEETNPFGRLDRQAK